MFSVKGILDTSPSAVLTSTSSVQAGQVSVVRFSALPLGWVLPAGSEVIITTDFTDLRGFAYCFFAFVCWILGVELGDKKKPKLLNDGKNRRLFSVYSAGQSALE